MTRTLAAPMLLGCMLFVAACGSRQASRPVPASTPAPPPPALVPTAEPAERSLPSACIEGPVCTPPQDFAARVCAGSYPEAALALFGPKTPWKRAYVQRSFQAWHVSGHGELRELRANEEVIILTANRGAEGQGAGGRAFDALRWDGTCVSLMEDELSFHKPAAPVPANIVWKKLDAAVRAALAEEKGIETLRAAQARTCDTSAAENEPGKSKCELARRQLSLAIAQSVGRGKALPAPASIP